jgi:HSP20 family protein
MVEVKNGPKPKVDVPQGQAKGPPIRAERPARRTPTLALAAASPFAFVRRFAEEIDRLFDDFGIVGGIHMPPFITRGNEPLRREAGLVEAVWSPQIDVMEKDAHIVVRADLPGINKDDIHVEVMGDTLTIQGERKAEKKEEREGYSYSECSYGRFYRALPLPEGTDVTKVNADFHNGVLEVSIPLPMKPEPQARRVEVREKK